MEALEYAVLDWIRLHLTCAPLDAVVPVFTRLCDHGELWIVLALALMLTRKHRRLGVSVACALVLDLVCCNLLIKPLVGRVRPFALRPDITLLIPPPVDASFPSGHSACSFAAAGALWFSGCRRGGAAAFAVAALMAFSRLYLYVHWPSDVLSGALLGLALGWLGAYLTQRLAARCKKM